MTREARWDAGSARGRAGVGPERPDVARALRPHCGGAPCLRGSNVRLRPDLGSGLRVVPAGAHVAMSESRGEPGQEPRGTSTFDLPGSPTSSGDGAVGSPAGTRRPAGESDVPGLST